MYFFQAVQKKIIACEFFVKLTQIKFRKNSLVFFQGGQKRKIMGILFKMNPDQIVGKFPCIFFFKDPI